MGKRKKETTTTETKIPSWLEAGSRQAVQMGQRIATRPYESYQGEAISPLSGNEQQAYNLAGEGVGAWQGDIDASREQLEGIKSFKDADMDAYMNPFIKQALDPVVRERNLRFEKERSAMRGGASMRGAFGGSRQAIMESELSRGAEQGISDIYATGYKQAFDTGQQAFQQDQNRRLMASGAYRGLAGAGAQLRAGDIDQLTRTGGMERDVRQRQALFDYGQFIEERDWDVNNLQSLLDAISRSPYGTTGTQTSTTSGGGSPLGMIAGLAAVAAGVYTMNPALIAAGGQIASGSGE